MEAVSHVSLADIHAAHRRLAGAIEPTPCRESLPLSEMLGLRLFCKQEFLHRTGSFKERGARNALMRLTPEQKKIGVIAASAGNHALGLSWHGRLLGIPVTVVMPRFAPLIKVSRCRQFGANVILHGDGFDDAVAEAVRLVEERHLTYVHGFDNLDVIAGQGTVGLEILEQVPEVEAIVIPVGGGGLIAGINVVTAALKPDVQIIGVEPANVASFTAALAAKTPVRLPTRYTLADGLAVAQAGRHPLNVALPFAPRMVSVREEEMPLAMLRLAEAERYIVEGSAAAGLAALMGDELKDLKDKTVVLLLTGGNIDPLAHARVIERGLAVDGRLYRFNASISDRPGGLAHLAGLLASVGASVSEIIHNRTFAAGPDLSRVHVLCTVETRDWGHIAEVNEKLEANGVHLMNDSFAIPPKSR